MISCPISTGLFWLSNPIYSLAPLTPTVRHWRPCCAAGPDSCGPRIPRLCTSQPCPMPATRRRRRSRPAAMLASWESISRLDAAIGSTAASPAAMPAASTWPSLKASGIARNTYNGAPPLRRGRCRMAAFASGGINGSFGWRRARGHRGGRHVFCRQPFPGRQRRGVRRGYFTPRRPPGLHSRRRRRVDHSRFPRQPLFQHARQSARRAARVPAVRRFCERQPAAITGHGRRGLERRGAQGFAGAERLWRFHVLRGWRRRAAAPLRWSFVDYSRTTWQPGFGYAPTTSGNRGLAGECRGGSRD